MMSPDEIVATKRSGNSVVGWKVDAEVRSELLRAISPRYERVIADHVTLAAKVASDTPLPARVCSRVIGRADDGTGVEALVVEIDGETDRPGGSTYHITWSLAAGRKAVESNDVIRKCGWNILDQPLPVTLIPARFP